MYKVYIVSYENGEKPKEAFLKEANAVEAIPETKRNYPCQISHKMWSYGKRKGSRVFIEHVVIVDRGGLPKSNF